MPAAEASLQGHLRRRTKAGPAPGGPAPAQDHSPQGQGGLGDEEGMLSFRLVPSLQSTSALHPSRCPVPSGWAPKSRSSTQEVPRVPADACGLSPALEQADLPPLWSRRHPLGSSGETGWRRTPPVVGADQRVTVRARHNPETGSKASAPTVVFV